MKKLYILFFAISASLFLNSCVESEISFLESAEELGFTGSTADIKKFLSDEAYNSILDLGIPINTGANPPDVEGAFLMSPYILEKTNIEDDFDIGYRFADKKCYFSNQDLEELSIDFFSETINADGEILSTETGLESFISGSGNNFTIIIKIKGKSQGSSGPVNFINGLAISGTLTSGGIKNMENAFVVIEKTGDIDDEFIDVGEGRLIVDGDNFSDRR
ncbi:hypothetical protein Aeqsu_0375 [Aequorivita sublithincola DSM 14238]|uniref:Uncharacterized protein n=1 Tax=Aequorivita sublithincola (strain DSM 14238 / LMG 21431 / ACAM 643 / 9-3) TaxID=746697 RepID=I3YSC0_AEQSU|nr:hypothetical protein [Aequorivita sublithincola]AFL79888.1 hypothetical protein Aeqsu_0375 [Aequorivita sublithincola DSM 14238]